MHKVYYLMAGFVNKMCGGVGTRDQGLGVLNCLGALSIFYNIEENH